MKKSGNSYHSVFRTEKCPFCDSWFGREAGVNQHVAKKHKDLRPNVESIGDDTS